ncbi:MAG: hypothetical protein UZ08_BCD001001275 [Candidatus Parvibacillus calidus]|nr:MAG: hypothetical protein UZ08_BCD001001275 [Candidatus Parvibacillus calidus]
MSETGGFYCFFSNFEVQRYDYSINKLIINAR